MEEKKITKICSKCKEEKVVEEFGKKKANKDGRSYWCKKCAFVVDRAWKEEIKRQNMLNFPSHTTLKCSICKKEKLVKYFCKNFYAKSGYKSSCKKCANKQSNKLRNKDAERRYREYTRGTIGRNFVPISFEQFQEITRQPCFYCAGWNDYELKFCGIDRVVNSKGYEEDNIVPCCKVCNILKGKMSRRAFIRACKKIARHTAGKGLEGRAKAQVDQETKKESV
jgi:hypothetical protein